MKNLLKIGVCALFAFTSCSKKDSNPSYHVSFKVNGTLVSHTGFVVAHTETNSGYTTLTLIGSETSASYDNFFGFYLDNDPGQGQIAAGEYMDNSTDFTLLANYTKNAVQYEAGQSVSEDADTYNITITHFKMKISAINGSTVKGTFSGDFYQDGDVQSGTKLSITEGDFYAQMQ